MSTIRQQIVDALVVRLKGITMTGDYSSDAGLNVYSWFPRNLGVDALPWINITDVSDALSDSGRDQTQHQLRVEVEGQVQGGTDVIESLRDLLGDIVSVIMDPEDRTLGGLCDNMDLLDGGAIQLEQRAENTVASVSLALGVTFRTDRGNWSVKI